MSDVIMALYGLALLPSAVFFGIAVYLFIAPAYDKLSGRAFVEFFHKVDPYMKVRAPRLGLARFALLLLLLGLTGRQWAGVPFWLTAAAWLLGVVSMVIAVRGNVPLGRQMDHWSPDAPPPGWETVRDRWLRYHDLRGAAEAASFVLLLAAALLYRPSTVPVETAGGPAPRCWEATVYLPLADNEGRSFAEAAWREALEGLVAPFGGATLGEPQDGCWVDPRGRVCRERVRPVVVSFAPDRLDEFRHAVRGAGTRLGQQAMYVRLEEPRVELVPVGASAGGGR
jgi:hypothetical protein